MTQSLKVGTFLGAGGERRVYTIAVARNDDLDVFSVTLLDPSNEAIEGAIDLALRAMRRHAIDGLAHELSMQQLRAGHR